MCYSSFSGRGRGPCQVRREHTMTEKDIQTSIKSYAKREHDRAMAAIELVRIGAYDSAILALNDANAYKMLQREYEFIQELEEADNA